MLVRKTILFLAVFLFLSFFLTSFVFAVDLPIKEMSCFQPIRIFGNSMEPRFQEGQQVFFNKCIDEIRNDLTPGTPVLFQREEERGISIAVIREKVTRPEGIFYLVSREDNPKRTEEISSQQLRGVYQPEEEMAGLTKEQQKVMNNFRGNPLIALGGLITTFIFWGAIFYWKKKTNVAWRFFWAAVLVWSIMIGVKMLMDFKLNPNQLFPGLVSTSLIGVVVTFFYYGLRTGLTENGFSYLYIKKKLKKASFSEAVAFGIAFNGVEALMVGFWTFGAGLTLFLRSDLLNFFPVHLRQEVIQAFGGSAAYIPAQWIERTAVLLGGIFASLLVFTTVKTGKWRYFFLAMIYKMVVDGGLAVYLMRYSTPLTENFVLWTYLIQIPAVIYGIIGLLGVFWLKKIYPSFSSP